MPKLVLFRGDAVETEIPLSGSPVRLGRHESNDVVLDDSQNGVSRFHAEVRREAGGYVIVDMKSRNGIWIGGRRIKDKAPLTLGVPVTIGGFELALEDDPSGTFVNESSAHRTSVRPASGAARSPARGPKPSATALSQRNQQILLASGAVLLLVVVCVVIYTAIRHRPAPPPVKTEVALTTIPVEAPPPPSVDPPQDPNKALNDEDLATASQLMAAKDYDGALSHLQAVLERDPENTSGAQMKREIEAIKSAISKPAPKPAEPPAVVAIAGIPAKAGETQPDYDVRANRIKSMLAEGQKALEAGDYATALARFRAVDREQPRYLNVDQLIADTQSRQQKAVGEAIASGRQSENAGDTIAARRSYDAALKYDPTSTAAQEARLALKNKMDAFAKDLCTKGETALVTQSRSLAEKYFKEVLLKTMPGDEYYDRAKKGLEEAAKR